MRTTGERRFTLILKALHAAPPGDWPRVEREAFDDYLVIDAADFGDVHNVPFVRRVERFDAETRALGRPAYPH